MVTISPQNKIQHLRDLLTQISELPPTDYGKLDALLKKTEMIFRRISLDDRHIKTLEEIDFSPMIVSIGRDNSAANLRAWSSGITELSNLINVIIQEIELFEVDKNDVKASTIEEKTSIRIFIVHGRNDEMKQIVARSIEKLGFEPIILHEQVNKGRTIIEKFEDYSDVGFAIILLSADDMGYLKSEVPKNAKSRARQNVIFEMGYFVGKLGRDRVLLLLEQGVERPSDIDGVVYTPYDSADGNWRTELFKELRACGYDVDANKLFR